RKTANEYKRRIRRDSCRRFFLLEKCHEFGKGPGAVADVVLALRLHLAEGLRRPVGNEDRIIAEASCPARRKRQRAGYLALEDFGALARTGQRQGANEFRRMIVRARALQFALYARDGEIKILLRAGPARGTHTGCAVEGAHDKTRIVGECSLARCPCGCFGFYGCIFSESFAGF